MMLCVCFLFDFGEGIHTTGVQEGGDETIPLVLSIFTFTGHTHTHNITLSHMPRALHVEKTM